MAERRHRTGKTALSLGRLDRLLGFHLRMASAALARDFAVAVEGLDLTQKQFAVLELIAANPHVSQTEIGGALGTDRATMMAVVDRLEARGLLTRGPAVNDRRRQALALTEAGHDLLREAAARVAAHEAGFRARLDETGAERLIALLRQIHATA
jgi:DNA-binding MarR family transcriptional regulator